MPMSLTWEGAVVHSAATCLAVETNAKTESLDVWSNTPLWDFENAEFFLIVPHCHLEKETGPTDCLIFIWDERAYNTRNQLIGTSCLNLIFYLLFLR